MWSTDIKDKSLASRVDKYTMTYITPQILKREFDLIVNHKSTTKDTNFTVKANKMTNEVTAIYEKDDAKLTSMSETLGPCQTEHFSYFVMFLFSQLCFFSCFDYSTQLSSAKC